jgi:hypothetical protein
MGGTKQGTKEREIYVGADVFGLLGCKQKKFQEIKQGVGTDRRFGLHLAFWVLFVSWALFSW